MISAKGTVLAHILGEADAQAVYDFRPSRVFIAMEVRPYYEPASDRPTALFEWNHPTIEIEVRSPTTEDFGALGALAKRITDTHAGWQRYVVHLVQDGVEQVTLRWN